VIVGFKVGDVVTGTLENTYNCTSANAIQVVTKINPHGTLKVKLLFGIDIILVP